jgi:hypothetical protein
VSAKSWGTPKSGRSVARAAAMRSSVERRVRRAPLSISSICVLPSSARSARARRESTASSRSSRSRAPSASRFPTSLGLIGRRHRARSATTQPATTRPRVFPRRSVTRAKVWVVTAPPARAPPLPPAWGAGASLGLLLAIGGGRQAAVHALYLHAERGRVFGTEQGTSTWGLPIRTSCLVLGVGANGVLTR